MVDVSLHVLVVVLVDILLMLAVVVNVVVIEALGAEAALVVLAVLALQLLIVLEVHVRVVLELLEVPVVVVVVEGVPGTSSSTLEPVTAALMSPVETDAMCGSKAMLADTLPANVAWRSELIAADSMLWNRSAGGASVASTETEPLVSATSILSRAIWKAPPIEPLTLSLNWVSRVSLAVRLA